MVSVSWLISTIPIFKKLGFKKKINYLPLRKWFIVKVFSEEPLIYSQPALVLSTNDFMKGLRPL